MPKPRDPVEQELDDSLDPRFDAWLAGTLDEAERTELEAKAETDAVVAAALEAFTPLSQGVHDAIIDRAVVTLQRDQRRRRIGVAAVGALALAAALVVWVGRPAPVMPQFAAGFSKTTLGSEPVVESFRLDEPFELLLVPESTPSMAPVLTVFVDGWTPHARRDVSIDTTSDGAFTLRGIFGEPPWALTPGDHVLHLVVGPQAPPQTGHAPRSPWVVVDRSVRILEAEDEPSP